MKAKLAMLIPLGIFIGHASHAAEYYIATNGNDNNPGTMVAAWKTLDAAQYKVGPGDTIYVRGGTYVQTTRFKASGKPGAPIKIMAFPGEKPILDGQNKLAANWGSMVNLIGNYIQMYDFEIKNGLGQGVVLSGHHNKLARCNIHHHAERGVLAAGDYSQVVYSKVWWNSWYHCQLSTCTPRPKPFGTGLSAARDKVDGVTDYAVLICNEVFNNWGEGLSTFEANGTIIEHNVVYDNYNINLYISDATNVVATENIVYTSPNPAIGRQTPASIGLSDEIGRPRSKNITIVNNFVMGGVRTLHWWVDPDLPDGRMENVLIAHNTFVDAANTAGWAASVYFREGDHRNVRFANNIVTQKGDAKCIYVGGGDIQFSNNLWSKPVDVAASSVDDIVADPQLARIGSFEAGKLRPAYFKLRENSPGIDKGTLLSNVLDDWFDDLRDATPDIGGHEF